MEFWDQLLATGVGAAIGVLAAKIWQRYLQRMVTIRWSVTHETLPPAVTTQDGGASKYFTTVIRPEICSSGAELRSRTKAAAATCRT